jgi:hypothetical protein
MRVEMCNLHVKHFCSAEYLTKYKQNIFIGISGEISVVRLSLKQYIYIIFQQPVASFLVVLFRL